MIRGRASREWQPGSVLRRERTVTPRPPVAGSASVDTEGADATVEESSTITPSRNVVKQFARGAREVAAAGKVTCFVPVQVGATLASMTFTVELEREEDGRWLAEVPALPGVMCYGQDRDEAVAKVQALALRVIAERLEYREAPAEFLNVTFKAA
jgi:predicted RNase H-like HicB family nuclease